MMFKQRVLRAVGKIVAGEFKTYKEVARLAGKPMAARTVGNILAENRSPRIPCHRVIKNDCSVGGFCGDKNFDWKKAAMLLSDGAVGAIPTDTIYGICGSAFNKKTVEKIYKLKKRKPVKPFIVLIGGVEDLKKFGVKISGRQKNFLNKVWPGKTSVILNCPLKKFAYLHRGTKTIAFRMPKSAFLEKILKISGPLAAPSANLEGKPPAKNVKMIKKYFGGKVFYLDGGEIVSKPSTLVDLTRPISKILRS